MLSKKIPAQLFNTFLFISPLLALAFICREVIFEGRIFSYFDVVTNYLPYYFFESKNAGLIDQHILAGFPPLVTISAAWFDPMRQIFFHFFDAIDTYRIVDLSYLLIAYVATYFYGRKIGMPHAAAILTASVYIFAGQVMLWSAAIGIAVYYALLPLVLLAIDHSLGAKKFVYRALLTFALGLLLGFGWLAGHVQFLVYVYMLAATYWLYRVALSPGRFTRYLSEAVYFAAVLFISACIGFPQIWSVLNFLPLTTRPSIPLTSIFAYSYYPQHLIQYLIPSFSIPYPPSLPRAFQNYIGILPFLVALFGFLHFKRFRGTPYLIFYAGAFLFCLLTAIYYSPIAAVMHYLPIFRDFRETVRIMFVGDFALAICIGLFMQRIAEDTGAIHESPRYYAALKAIWLWCVIPGIAACTIIKLFFVTRLSELADAYFVAHLYPHTTGKLPLEHYFSLIHTGISQSVAQLSLQSGDILALVVFGTAAYMLLRSLPAGRKYFLPVAAILVSLNFAVIYAGYVHTISKGDLLSEPSTASFIKAAQKESGVESRVFSPLSGAAFYNQAVRCDFPDIGEWNMDEQSFLLHKELLDPNLNHYYGLDLLDGYEPYMTEPMSHLSGYLGGSSALDNDEYGINEEKNSLEEKLATLLERKNLYSAFNVGYLLTLVPISHVGFTQSYTTTVGTCKIPVFVYSISNVWPRYFITNKISEIASDATFLAWMDRMNTLGEPTVVLDQKSMLQNTSQFLQSVFPSFTKDGILLDTKTDKDGYLYIGNTWLPGYAAFVDGMSMPILKANYAMMAIYLPAGAHHIELHYTAVPPTWSALFTKASATPR